MNNQNKTHRFGEEIGVFSEGKGVERSKKGEGGQLHGDSGNWTYCSTRKY